jgi:hypothetical protein
MAKWTAALLALGLAGCGRAPGAPVPIARVQGTAFDLPAIPVKKAEPALLPPPPPPPSPVAPEPKGEAPPEPKPAPPAPPPPVVETPVAVKPPEPPPEPPMPVEEPKPAPVEAKPVTITFTTLAFRYWPQPKTPGARDPFPKEIKAMNGKAVTIDGYMFPIDFEKGKVRSFLLSRGMFGCCYGDSPQITEVITVTRADGKSMPFEAMARVTGILEVGEVYDGEGYVDSVYRIKADAVGPAPGGK